MRIKGRAPQSWRKQGEPQALGLQVHQWMGHDSASMGRSGPSCKGAILVHAGARKTEITALIRDPPSPEIETHISVNPKDQLSHQTAGGKTHGSPQTRPGSRT